MGTFALPLLAKAVTPLLIASTVATGVGGIQQAGALEAQGKQTEADLKRQAELERLTAKDRSIARRRRLNKVLAGQIAETGARGIAFEGSPQAVAKGDIRQFELEKLGAQVSDLERITQLKRTGKSARRSGKQAGRATLLSTFAQVTSQGSQISSLLKPKPPTTT